jgi:hypothetical protein
LASASFLSVGPCPKITCQACSQPYTHVYIHKHMKIHIHGGMEVQALRRGYVHRPASASCMSCARWGSTCAALRARRLPTYLSVAELLSDREDYGLLPCPLLDL